jgi:hypothetical protein
MSNSMKMVVIDKRNRGGEKSILSVFPWKIEKHAPKYPYNLKNTRTQKNQLWKSCFFLLVFMGFFFWFNSTGSLSDYLLL